MSMVTEAPDTETADRYVRAGLATKGDLIVSGGSGRLFEVERCMKGGVNYSAFDEDGKNWKVRVATAKAAPAGAVFASKREDPGTLWPGTVVEFVSGKYADQGLFVVLRENGATVSLTKLGGEWQAQYIRGAGKGGLRVVKV